MPERYYVSMWALRREAEIAIHPDYLKLLPREKILAALQSIHRMLHRMYRDIAQEPWAFRMPKVPISRFEFEPRLQDIPAYSKLVELGKDR